MRQKTSFHDDNIRQETSYHEDGIQQEADYHEDEIQQEASYHEDNNQQEAEYHANNIQQEDEYHDDNIQQEAEYQSESEVDDNFNYSNLSKANESIVQTSLEQMRLRIAEQAKASNSPSTFSKLDIDDNTSHSRIYTQNDNPEEDGQEDEELLPESDNELSEPNEKLIKNSTYETHVEERHHEDIIKNHNRSETILKEDDAQNDDNIEENIEDEEMQEINNDEDYEDHANKSIVNENIQDRSLRKSGSYENSVAQDQQADNDEYHEINEEQNQNGNKNIYSSQQNDITADETIRNPTSSNTPADNNENDTNQEILSSLRAEYQSEIKFLRTELSGKEQVILHLKDTTNESEKYIQKLEASIPAKDSEIESLRKKLEENGAYLAEVKNLQASLLGKDEQIKELRTALAQTELELAKQQDAFYKNEKELTDLTVDLQQKLSEAQKAEKAKWDEKLATLTTRLHAQYSEKHQLKVKTLTQRFNEELENIRKDYELRLAANDTDKKKEAKSNDNKLVRQLMLKDKKIKELQSALEEEIKQSQDLAKVAQQYMAMKSPDRFGPLSN